MSATRKMMLAAAPVALLALGGCAQSFSAKVNRFAALPAPPAQGQSFVIKAADPKLDGGLEFRSYAKLVARELERFGYREATGDGAANLTVTLDYGVDNGRERITTTPGFGGFGGFGGWGGGWGGWGWGGRWVDPFWGPGFGPGFGGGWGADVRSYTIYNSQLRMEISEAGGQRVFEGTARAVSRSDDLPYLVPNLVEAMFTGFPGNSGETVTIKIPPKKK
ncbi:DUF4136 domain-containing protein [Sphingomonas changnyeongensis]|uniref:DUF4136 domain-containing protein n=1 Tax=Sphingomonas changnyeongensis TaxID=2698679 RepID=A0A7Z2NY02_9SPHN|nr:DUF4136 domain-containing protein [Sphingomonas changnyeongensis]QHL91496.1 DUF4136 domain-containing protein [Sphingomonas changnyeongensis]